MLYSRAELVILAQAYCDHTSYAISTLSKKILNNDKVLRALVEGRDCEMKNAERLTAWMNENWPDELPWPKDIPGPPPKPPPPTCPTCGSVVPRDHPLAKEFLATAAATATRPNGRRKSAPTHGGRRSSHQGAMAAQ
jgi:hypothetical protein